MSKRIISLMLALILLVSSLPMQAYATEADIITENDLQASDTEAVFMEDVTLSLGSDSEISEGDIKETSEADEMFIEEPDVTTEENAEPTESTEGAGETTGEATEPTEEAEYASNVVPEGYVPRSYTPDVEMDLETEEVKYPNRRVLLIEDNLPWHSTANHQILSTMAQYDTVKPSDIGKVDVSKYAVIILANDQATSSYTAYARFADKIEEFAERGGVIVFGACDAGWSDGYMSDIIPGGVQKINRYMNYNTVADTTHPIVTGQLTDNRVLTDGDLYSTYCSHACFLEDTFPEGTRIILREKNGYPTLIEYPLGNGRVIASGLTWEYTLAYVGTFASVAMDDLYNYALYVSGIGNQDQGHLMHDKIKDTDHLVVVADSKTQDPIANAEVIFNGKKGTTDENGKLLFKGVKTGRVAVTVKQKGYRTRTLYSKVTGGDMEYIFLEPYNGSGAYITGADAKIVTKKKDGTKQTKEYDLFQETVDIRDDAEYTITLRGEWNGKKAGSYMLYLGSQCAYSSNGVFTIKNGKCSNSRGKEIEFADGRLHARMVTSDGKQSEAAELNLYSPKKSEGSLWEDSDLLFSIGGKDGIKIAIPKNMPVIGGMEFQVKLDEIPTCVEIKEDSIKIAIGINKLNEEEDPDKAMADWKKRWEDVDRTQNLKEVLKGFDGKSGGFTLKKGWDDVDLDIIGYAEGKFDKETGKISELSGGFVLSVDMMYRYNQQFIVGPVPVYFEIGGGVEAEDEGQVQGVLIDAKQLILDNSLTITPKFSIGGGVGVNGALSVGAEGTAKLPIVLCDSTWNVTDQTFDVFSNVSLAGEMDLTASLLFVFNAKHSIAKGEWQIMRYYWNTGEIELFEAEDLAAQSVTDFSDTSSFYLMDRSYLNDTSDWYTDDVSVASFQNGMTTLQTGVMPTADPQIVCCDDGTAIMVFQSDDPERSSLNRSCLMYSVYQNGIWSAPEPVWDNGCADMAASLATGPAGTYVVWQKLNQVLSDDTSVDSVATHVEIASAVFDPDTGSFVEAAYLTNDNVLQMMPSVAVGPKEVIAHYVTNTSNQLLGGGTNEIVRRNLSSGSTSVLYSGSAYVTCLTSYVGPDSVNTAYILDADSNLKTVNDTQLYINGKQISTVEGAKLNAQYCAGTLYWFEDTQKTIYSYSNGKVHQLMTPDASVGTNFQIMQNGSKFGVVWIGLTDEGEHCIYAKIKNGNTWSAPVELVTSESSLMQLAGYLNKQGRWELVTLSKEGENSANLLYSGVTPYLTTTAKNISYIARNRDDLYPKILAEFSNGSENTLDHLNVDICDAYGNMVHSQIVECNILGGENKKLVLDIDLPVQTDVMEYTVIIYPEGEENLSDNQGTITVGYSDLSLLLETHKQGSNTMVNVRIYNDSDLSSTATLTVREGNPDTGIIVDMRSLGNLNPGETYNYNYNYNLSTMDFHGQDSKVYYYQVTGSAAESIVSNNQDSLTFKNPNGSTQQTPTSIYVNAPDPVELNLDTARTYQIDASTEPAASGDWKLLYSSSDANIAAVDEKGLIQAVREGTATITIRAENTEITREITVVVEPPTSKKLTLKLTEVSAATTDFQMNDVYSVEVYGNGDIPMDNHLFTFSSSNENILEVNEDNGTVTVCLLQKGTAKLNVAYCDNKKLKAAVNIKVIAEKPGSITLNYKCNGQNSQESLQEISTQSLNDAALQLTPVTYNERGVQMVDATYSFASSNTAVAKVDKDGLVTGTGKEGIAVISAKPNGSSISTELTLYVFDSGAPLLAADTTITLNTYMTSAHPDAPVIQLQSIHGDSLSFSGRLYRLKADGTYAETDINVRNLENNGSGLYTLALGCDSQLQEKIKSGDYYLCVVSNDETYYIRLNLKITQKLPDVQVRPDSFNLFFADQTGKLQVTTNETVVSVGMTEAASAKGKLTGAFCMENRWNSSVGMYENHVVPNYQLISSLQQNGLKKYNLKYTFTVALQNYNVAVAKTLEIPVTYTVPIIRLSSPSIYASTTNSIITDVKVKAFMGKTALPFADNPSYSTEFGNYGLFVSNASQDGSLSLNCPSLDSGSVTGKLNVKDNNWRHSVPVALKVISQNLSKSCKINTFNVNVITKQMISQDVLIAGKQKLKLQSNTLVENDLFHIYADSNGIHVTPIAKSSEYKSSYKYAVSLVSASGEIIYLPINIRVSKSSPSISSPSKLYLDGTQRRRTITATLSGNLDWDTLDVSKTSTVIKKGRNLSTDISAVYAGKGNITITTRQKCTGNYTVQIMPVLSNGENLKTINLQIVCTTNATAVAKVQKNLDMREHLTSETAVTLTLKNTSAKVESITIINGFSSIFEARNVELSGKNPVITIGLKDGLDIAGGTYSLPLELTLSDGSKLSTSANIKVIGSKLTVSLSTMIMAQPAKSYTITKAFNPKLKDGAAITGICNADNKSPFQVSYSNGIIKVTANKRAAIKKGTYTINCVVYASNDLINAPGTPCKLRVIVR